MQQQQQYHKQKKLNKIKTEIKYTENETNSRPNEQKNNQPGIINTKKKCNAMEQIGKNFSGRDSANVCMARWGFLQPN